MEPNWFPTQPFQGWSVKILPVRSTVVALPRIWMEDHAFNPATDDEGCGTAAGFFGSGPDPLGGAAFRGRSSSGTRCDSSVFLKAAKSRSLPKRYSSPLLMTSSGVALMK